MTVIKALFLLSLEQWRFFDMREGYPTLGNDLDIDERGSHHTELQTAIEVLFHGGRLVAPFFHALRSGSDALGTGLVEEASTLVVDDRTRIAAWRTDPFYS